MAGLSAPASIPNNRMSDPPWAFGEGAGISPAPLAGAGISPEPSLGLRGGCGCWHFASSLALARGCWHFASTLLGPSGGCWHFAMRPVRNLRARPVRDLCARPVRATCARPVRTTCARDQCARPVRATCARDLCMRPVRTSPARATCARDLWSPCAQSLYNMCAIYVHSMQMLSHTLETFNGIICISTYSATCKYCLRCFGDLVQDGSVNKAV